MSKELLQAKEDHNQKQENYRMKNLTSKGKHIVLYIVTTNQKSVIDMSTKKEKESKHNAKDGHQIRREESRGY